MVWHYKRSWFLVVSSVAARLDCNNGQTKCHSCLVDLAPVTNVLIVDISRCKKLPPSLKLYKIKTMAKATGSDRRTAALGLTDQFRTIPDGHFLQGGGYYTMLKKIRKIWTDLHWKMMEDEELENVRQVIETSWNHLPSIAFHPPQQVLAKWPSFGGVLNTKIGGCRWM